MDARRRESLGLRPPSSFARASGWTAARARISWTFGAATAGGRSTSACRAIGGRSTATIRAGSEVGSGRGGPPTRVTGKAPRAERMCPRTNAGPGSSETVIPRRISSAVYTAAKLIATFADFTQIRPRRSDRDGFGLPATRTSWRCSKWATNRRGRRPSSPLICERPSAARKRRADGHRLSTRRAKPKRLPHGHGTMGQSQSLCRRQSPDAIRRQSALQRIPSGVEKKGEGRRP